MTLVPAPRCPAWKGFVDDLAPPLLASERSAFAGRRILITGAGGYIGSALARFLAGCRPAHLLLLDTAEYGLFRVGEHLRNGDYAGRFSLVVGDVNDQPLLQDLFTNHPPEIIFHAAACKHVPLMEDNPFAAASVNVVGTRALVDAASGAGAAVFVLLSTDKAVEPHSVMGATKRVAEQIVLEQARLRTSTTRFKVLRLCNILGSTGSVAPLFERQLRAGTPLTVTHPDATRYFLSRRDAVRLILRTAVDDIPSSLLVVSLSEPRRIEDLARFMLRTAAVPARDPAITYSGLRQADKLSERLLASAEHAVAAVAPLLQAVSSPFSSAGLHQALAQLRAGVTTRDRDPLFAALALAVPDFHPRRTATSNPALQPEPCLVEQP